MKKIVALSLLAVLVAVGCSAPPPPPPKKVEAPKPVEPSPEQIASEIRPSIAPLQSALQPGSSLAPGGKETVVAALKTAHAKHQATDNGKLGMAQVTTEVEDIIKQAKEANKWRLAMAAIEAYEALRPESKNYERMKATAQLQLNKPRVKIKGFFIDQAKDNEVYAWLQLTDAKTSQSHTVKVREGEEFDRLKLIKIIGTEQGVTLEYLDSPGDVFDIMKDPHDVKKKKP